MTYLPSVFSCLQREDQFRQLFYCDARNRRGQPFLLQVPSVSRFLFSISCPLKAIEQYVKVLNRPLSLLSLFFFSLCHLLELQLSLPIYQFLLCYYLVPPVSC